MLATDKESNIIKGTDIDYLTIVDRWSGKGFPQHLYILSDDKIKEGDWFINRQYFADGFVKNNEASYAIWQHNGEIIPNSEPKKIIATTDSSLNLYCNHCNSIKELATGMCVKCGKFPTNSIPLIHQMNIDLYVRYYNKGIKIEEVLVEYEENAVDFNGKYPLKIHVGDRTINIKPIKDSWTREEVITVIRATFYLEDRLQLDEWIKSNL